jgi:putative oxidoreductase
MRFLPLLGRILFSAIFIHAAFGHFSSGTIAYAASHGVPMASIAVPLSGIISFLGGLSILLGFKAKIGAVLIIIFLVPVTVSMHAFWGIQDPMQAMTQEIMFMKNISILGGAILTSYFGSGPLSLDNLKKCAQ